MQGGRSTFQVREVRDVLVGVDRHRVKLDDVVSDALLCTALLTSRHQLCHLERGSLGQARLWHKPYYKAPAEGAEQGSVRADPF